MSKARSVLGKGLGALIPGVETPQEVSTLIEERVVDVPYIALKEIKPNPFQPRKEFPEAELEELTASIREHGIIQPVTVRKRDGYYELIAGERRLRAAERAGLVKIPAFVLDVDDERKMLELAIIENVQRQDLNPIEEAESYKRLIDECGLRQDEVAERISRDRTTVSNFLRLLRLPDEIKDSLRRSELGMGHAKAILGIDDPAEQINLWRSAVAESLSVRRLEELARKIITNAAANGNAKKKAGRPIRPVADESSEASHILDQLKQTLQTQVRISTNESGRGTLIIEFYSDDDRERIIDLLLSIRQ